MATAPDIFTKSCTYNTTEPCLRMQTRGLLLRLTGLPTNWKKARVAMIASLTAASGDNAAPVSENNAGGWHGDWIFGLSDGVGFPGDVAGGKFVGFDVAAATNNIYVRNPGPCKISGNGSTVPMFTRGVWTNNASTGGSAISNTLMPTMTDPTAATGYAFGMMIEMDVSTVGSLTVAVGLTNSLDRADAAQMSSILNMAATLTHAAVTGGWWSGSVPVGCQYFFMRWPLSLNSMRIHNYDFIQLA
ncbi:MAG: hypothetical protein WCG85_14630 [Polyangia bacterium]